MGEDKGKGKKWASLRVLRGNDRQFLGLLQPIGRNVEGNGWANLGMLKGNES